MKTWRATLKSTALCGAVLLAASCQKASVREIVAAASKDAESANPPTSSDVAPSSARVGVKNFIQLYRSMSVVTGVPVTEASVTTVYNAVKSQLPQSNDVGSLQASHQSAIVKLASQFCDRLFESDSLRSQLFPEVNFTVPPATALTAQTKALIAPRLADKFWGEEQETHPERASVAATISELVDQLMVGAPNSGPGTRSVFKGACTAVLSSAPFIVL